MICLNMITVVHGFKIRIETQDKILVAHGFPQGTDTSTSPSIYKHDNRSTTKVQMLSQSSLYTSGKGHWQ